MNIMSKILPFTYLGSKYRSFDFINDKLPRTRQYVEPYGGAATLLLNRRPVMIETYNDLRGDIPHFFRVLRNQTDELLTAIRQTPWSRDEFDEALALRVRGYPDCSDVERARLFFVCVQQSRSTDSARGSSEQWSYQVKGGPRDSNDCKTAKWKHRVNDALPEVAGRLTDVQIESKPAIEVIQIHDRDTATFYVDPPYPHTTRGNDQSYHLEMTEEDHRELASVLSDCEGYVALSGYNSDLYEELYSDWYRYTEREKSASEGEGKRREVLWTNYDADELGGRKIGDWPEPTRKGKQLTLTGAVEEATSD